MAFPTSMGRLGALAAAAFGCSLVFAACSSDSAKPGGQGGAAGALSDAGNDGGLCPAVPSCTTSGEDCPSLFPSCMGGACCLEQFGCLECNCDPQCPRERPFCQGGLCSECGANRDCPAARPCCEMEPDGGRYRCAACS